MMCYTCSSGQHSQTTWQATSRISVIAGLHLNFLRMKHWLPGAVSGFVWNGYIQSSTVIQNYNALLGQTISS